MVILRFFFRHSILFLRTDDMLLLIAALGLCRDGAWSWVLRHTAWTSSWVFVGTAAFAVTVPVVLYFLAKDWTRTKRGKVFPHHHPSHREIVELFAFEMAFITAANLASWRWVAPRLPPLPLPPEPPAACGFALELGACLVVGDILLWLYHVAVHKVRCLRRSLHAAHHTYHYPYVLGGIYTHPLENLIAAALQLVWPALVPTHPYSWWSAFLVWTVVQLDEHSGYDEWWSGEHWLPCGIGAKTHSVHHIDGTKNYGFVFNVWDRIAGTYCAPTLSRLKHTGATR